MAVSEHSWDRPGRGTPPPSPDRAARAVWTRNLPGTAILCLVAFTAAAAPERLNYDVGAAVVLAIAVTGLLPRPRVADVLALLLAVWAFATLMWNITPQPDRFAAYLYAWVAGLFIAVRHMIRCGGQPLLIGYGYLAGGAVTAVRLISGVDESQAAHRTDAMDLSVRFGIEGVNYNYTSYTLVTAAMLALVLLQTHQHGRAVKVCLYALVGLCGYGVWLTGTRGGLVALGLGAAYLILSRVLLRLTWTVVAVATPVLLVAVPLGMTGDRQLLWWEGLLGRSTGDLAGRLYIWPDALSMWSDSFLVGNGVGAFQVMGSYQIGAHNLLLTLGNDLGLVGLLLYAGVFAAAIAGQVRRVPAARRPIGLFLAMLLPVWLTGHWETSAGVWLTLGLLSVVIPQPAAAPRPDRRVRPASWPAPAPSGRHGRTGDAVPVGISGAGRR